VSVEFEPTFIVNRAFEDGICKRGFVDDVVTG